MKVLSSEILKLDGRIFYYSFLAGANSLIEHQREINKINVFPVADADTGSNLVSTIRSIIDNVKPEKSFKNTIDRMAEAALIGARGNSGLIFAQFFYGLSAESKKSTSIDLSSFAETAKNSIVHLYAAVSNPIEGTMLTVIREWAEFVHENRAKTSDFSRMFHDAFTEAKRSLAETTTRLKVLAKANVVDAGAKGFVVFLEGILELLQNRNLRSLYAHQNQVVEFDHETIISHDDFTHRYCTEAILKGRSIDRDHLKHLLAKHGDSVVVAGAGHINRIHVHTDQPAILFEELRQMGTLSYQKADDMKKQFDLAHRRKHSIALVTDSTCDLPQDFLDEHQINVVSLNLNFGENQYLDKLTIQPAQFYDYTDQFPDFPKTSQPNEQAFANLYAQLLSHYDSVIAVHLTGKFSGTLNTSRKAALKISQEFGKPISVLDSRTLSGALGLLIARIAREITNGKSHEDIVRSAEDWIGKTRIFVAVKDFRYMVRGGRVSPLKGKIAKLMHVKPIVSMDKDGNALLLDKTFSQKGNIKRVMKHVRDIYSSRGINNYILLHARNLEGAEDMGLKMLALTQKPAMATLDISPVIGLSAGRGAVAVALDFE
jgi:hypothetical protein